MIGASRFGKISRNMIRASEAPSAREACTNSRSRSDSTRPRTIRAMYVQVASAIRKMITAEARLERAADAAATAQAAPMPRPSSRIGIDSTTSMRRESSVSTQPR